MIEVNMTVNELTENTNISVASGVLAELKNPLIRITVDNMYRGGFPPTLKMVDIIKYENGYIFHDYIRAFGQQQVTGYAVADYDEIGDVFYYYLNADDMTGIEIKDLVNMYIEPSDERQVFIDDPSQEASMTILFYPENPLPDARIIEL